ncbi:MAG: precorrin-8X methylmutase, partial [candidate division NC10 bacterium]|nr:precorrin-8X methylmutase [candidate division NC10 bacterium]
MTSKPARIHELEQSPLSGEEIERRSFSIINREAPRHRFNPDEWEIVRRMIHTTGDFGIMEDVRFVNDA